MTALLYPHEEHPRYESNILVSGGADFSVHVWDMFTGTMMHRFCCQAGEIEHLVVPPENCNVSFVCMEAPNQG